MTDEEEMVRVTHRVPKSARDEAQNRTEHGAMSEHVRQVYNRVAFGEEVDQREQMKKRLDRIRGKKDDFRSKIREIENEIQTIEAEETRLEERLNETQSDKDRLDGALEMLEDELYSGNHLFKSHPRVQTAANTAGVSAEEVVEMLQARNPEIPEYAYKQKMHATEEWAGIPGYGDADEGGLR